KPGYFSANPVSTSAAIAIRAVETTVTLLVRGGLEPAVSVMDVSPCARSEPGRTRSGPPSSRAGSMSPRPPRRRAHRVQTTHSRTRAPRGTCHCACVRDMSRRSDARESALPFHESASEGGQRLPNSALGQLVEDRDRLISGAQRELAGLLERGVLAQQVHELVEGCIGAEIAVEPGEDREARRVLLVFCTPSQLLRGHRRDTY